MILSFRTDRSGQTVQTQIRLLLEEQFDQGLHCLSFRLHLLDTLLCGRATLLAHLYQSTGRAIAVTMASALASTSALLKMLKFLVKVFKSLYLLNPWMDLVDTLPDDRYWSEVLCCTITTHINDLEVKVTDFEILS